MANLEQIADRWAQVATGKATRLLAPRSANIWASHDGRTLYSYGSHFPLAEIHTDDQGQPAWFLLNGDRYSVSTSRHQNTTLSAVQRTGLPHLTLPFTALGEAGIDRATITPVEVLADSYETTEHGPVAREDVPAGKLPPATRNEYSQDDSVPGGWAVTEVAVDPREITGSERDYHAWLEDDGWHWRTRRHWLGSALFTADYHFSGYADPTDRESWRTVEGSATFLSAFDDAEPGRHYFLCQLPGHPQTYAEAIESLKPMIVANAEAEGKAVLRQGDVFAIPCDKSLTERVLLNSGGQWVDKRKPGEAYVLGVNHVATSAIVRNGETYARGFLRHRPRESWRSPEHRQVKLGDRVTWYLLAKNTVPEGRSWSMGGNVD